MQISKQSTAMLLFMSLLYCSSSNVVFAENNIEQLKTISVTTTLHDTDNAPGSISVLTANDLAKRNITKLSDIIGDMAGVNTRTHYGRQEYNIRGMSGKYTLILVNGKRVSSKNALWRGSNFDNMPVAIGKVQSIEVLRGPMSALYGSDAIGGVINIITKAPNDDLGGYISVGGSHAADLKGGDGHNLSGYLERRLAKNLSASITFQTDSNSEWNNGDPHSAFILEGIHKKDLGTSLLWNITDKQSMEFDFDYSKDHRDNGIYRILKKGKKENPLFREQTIIRKRYGISHNIDWDWGDTSTFINFEDNKIEDFNTAYAKISPPILHNIKEKNFHLKTYSHIDNLSNQVITIGAEYFKTIVKDPYSYKKTGEGKTYTLGLFLQDEINIKDNINLTLGGRYDKHDVFGGKFSPKVYLSYEPNDNLTIKGGISTAFKAPGIYQLNPEYTIVSCGGKCSISGDPTLQPEIAKSIELATLYRKDNLKLGLTGFYTKSKDYIKPILKKENGKATKIWANIDKVNIYGLEFESEFNITDSLYATLNYTYLNAKDDKHKKLTNVSSHQIFGKLNWEIIKDVTSFISANYESKKIVAVRKGPHISYVNSPSIFTWNIGSNIKYNNFNFNVGIDNVGNVKIHEKYPYMYKAPGRVYYANIRYDF